MEFMKAERLGSAKWRVLAIPFGGEFKGGKDADGEFFTLRTDVYGPYKGILRERPVAFHHGKDPGVDIESIGVEDDLELDQKLGWWAKLWLDRSHRYHAAIDALLQAGKMYGSSGSIGQFVRKNYRTGEILVWPHLEQTLTPVPANRLSIITPSKALADFESAGIATKALSFDLDSPMADLPSDLPSGGNEAAIQRLRDKVASDLERLKTL